jgi:hypothetical protein
VDEAVLVGTVLKIRPLHNLASFQWFLVEVRNCRPERVIWLLGCRFLQELAWRDLRFFS